MNTPESERCPNLDVRAGRKIALSAPRRVMCDLLAYAKAIPSVPVQRLMHIPDLVAARARLAQTQDAPSWCAIFTKAYGLMAVRYPELRRAYMPFPRAHLYEHP